MISTLRYLRTPLLLVRPSISRQLSTSQLIENANFQPGIYDSKRFEDLLYKKVKLVSATRQDAWRKEFPTIVQDLLKAPLFEELTGDNTTWIQDMVNHTTPHGKGIRAFQVILADKYLSNDTSPENLRNVHALAWLMELLQAGLCVVDDILDESETRRDRLCWHKVNKQGFPAFNGGLLLLAAPTILLDKYFGKSTFYSGLHHLFAFVTHACIYGECSDVRNVKSLNFETYNLNYYKDMMMVKNGYYTFYIPVAAAMVKNGICDEAALKEVEDLSLDIGLIYSIQDDFMDCFVDPKLTGKIGTDIEEHKSTWLFVNALDKCSTTQRRLLLKNYGSKDQAKVDVVKGLYRDVGIPQLYKTWEEQTMDKTLTKIGQLSTTRIRPLFY